MRRIKVSHYPDLSPEEARLVRLLELHGIAPKEVPRYNSIHPHGYLHIPWDKPTIHPSHPNEFVATKRPWRIPRDTVMLILAAAHSLDRAEPERPSSLRDR
jgi:hypothetical protein